MAAYVEELQDATYQLADGTVYTKYDWAAFMRDSQLYGLMGRNKSGLRLGVWNITPSFEWISGGADKQDLTVHATDKSPLMLQMMQSRHFGGAVLSFGEDQQKLYGPYLIYINSGATQSELTADAKSRAAAETAAWPYSWFDNDLYPISRATVTGRIILQDNFGTTRLRVALAQPGTNPLVQGTDYQYWAETDAEGNFTIDKVRPGSYALYAYALNGSATGKLVTGSYVITAGENALGDIAWQPAKYEELLWQIGAADHSTAGFCLSDHARQYGLWNQVPADLTYTIGVSNPQTDWYYAQTQEGTWTVNFTTTKTYSEPLHLTIATAGASGSGAKLEVKFNGNEPLQNIQYDNDAGVYRSAVLGGRDSTVVIEVPASQIVNGANTMTLRLWNKPSNGLGGIMYDCIKLEAGSTVTAIRSLRKEKTDDESAVYDLYGRRLEKGRLAPGVYITNGRKQIIK
jgi:rhamnogalacturonan endolyase